MPALFNRLMALAEARPDLTVRQLPGLDNAGYYVNKDGVSYIFLDRDLRPYRKVAVLAHELGHFGRRRRDFDPEVSPPPAPAREALADRFSRRLLWLVRLGLDPKAPSSPKRHARPGESD